MTSLAKDKIRVLLLEGVHANAVADLHASGYVDVEQHAGSLSEQELIDRLPGVWFLGIRSRTQVTERVLAAADRLISIGCFCIGTDQVELDAARARGIPVFNAPFSNTRSVAELVMGEIIMLMRGIFPKSAAAHQGQWVKSAANSWEVRGKTLGIVGYGNIGTQLSVMAEAIGMRVLYFDPVPKLALGQAQRVASLGELLESSDVVSLHVPDTLGTQGMIGADEIARMRRGSYLINAARGRVIDVDALAHGLQSGHLLGAAIDVFPREPKSKDEDFVSPLRGIPNVILTPHIGGSTLEAQARIGHEVAQKLIDYADIGTTAGAVNFPQVQLHPRASGLRFMHVHRNMPGMLARTLDVFTRRGININAQYLETDSAVGYVVMDVDGAARDPGSILSELVAIEGTIRARFIYDRA